MEEIEIISLNDNNYYVMDRINIDNLTYIVLLNVNNETDLIVRKELTKEDKKYLAKLENEEELQKVLKEFANKNN